MKPAYLVEVVSQPRTKLKANGQRYSKWYKESQLTEWEYKAQQEHYDLSINRFEKVGREWLIE